MKARLREAKDEIGSLIQGLKTRDENTNDIEQMIEQLTTLSTEITILQKEVMRYQASISNMSESDEFAINISSNIINLSINKSARICEALTKELKENADTSLFNKTDKERLKDALISIQQLINLSLDTIDSERERVSYIEIKVAPIAITAASTDTITASPPVAPGHLAVNPGILSSTPATPGATPSPTTPTQKSLRNSLNIAKETAIPKATNQKSSLTSQLANLKK